MEPGLPPNCGSPWGARHLKSERQAHIHYSGGEALLCPGRPESVERVFFVFVMVVGRVENIDEWPG